MIMLTDEERTALEKKYFPRVEWTALGPARRVYEARTAAETPGGVTAALAGLAVEAGFIEPGQRAVTGGPEETLEALRRKGADRSIGMVFGDSAQAHWCDIAVEPPGAGGWQRLVIRSEEGENLVALAHAEGVLRFRRANY